MEKGVTVADRQQKKNICHTGPREEGQTHGPELILKTITRENFPKTGKDPNSHTEGLTEHLRKLTPNH